jgi:CDP-diacylglycerol---glycerol-3-phosphate 3-phosphatidyltransferase
MKVSANLPNYLTVGRILLTIAFIFCLTQTGTVAAVLATLLFMAASGTDFYDGYLAKKYNLVSNFGKIMDPIADKFLILSAFFIFTQRHMIPYWMFYLIFVREVVVTGSRLKAIGNGKVLAAEKAGKCKTLAQLFAIWIILLFIVFQESGGFAMVQEHYRYGWSLIIAALMVLTVILTIVSGLSYFWNNWKIISSPATSS